MKENITPIPYEGDEPYIFVSYSHKDKNIVFPIIKHLQDVDYRIWYDEGIDPGTEWGKNIADHLEGCHWFLPMLSENYIKSDNCQDELFYARENKKNRLPIYLEDVVLPGDIKMKVGRLEAIYFYKYDNKDNFYEKFSNIEGINCCQYKKMEKIKLDTLSKALQNPEKLDQLYDDYMTNIVKRSRIKKAEDYAFDAVRKHADAQRQLGLCFMKGLGIERDYKEAVSWLEKAAKQGDAEAQFNLGMCKLNGLGTTKDVDVAISLFIKSEKLGNTSAQNALGMCYYYGQGVDRDLKKAIKLLTLSANKNDANAQYNLGICYLNGQGVKQDYDKAFYLFKRSAEQGNGYAEYSVGRCYEKGVGISRDYNMAKEWYEKAAQQGVNEARESLSDMRK